MIVLVTAWDFVGRNWKIANLKRMGWSAILRVATDDRPSNRVLEIPLDPGRFPTLHALGSRAMIHVLDQTRTTQLLEFENYPYPLRGQFALASGRVMPPS